MYLFTITIFSSIVRLSNFILWILSNKIRSIKHGSLYENIIKHFLNYKIKNFIIATGYKNELIDAIAEEADLSKASAGRALDAAINAITGALTKQDTVSLVGFGTFSVKHRAAREGRNPRSGETIQIKASNAPGFKAGKALKDAVNS